MSDQGQPRGDPDVAALAALGHGIARDRPFIGGNKRTAFVAVVELVPVLDGDALAAAGADCVVGMPRPAGGVMDVGGFAAWIRERIRPLA